MQHITGLSDILSKHQYTIIASDVYGVLHDGANPYPYSRECLKKLHDHNLETILLSNSSRLGHILADDLERKYGIDKTTYNRVLSSGDVTRQFLQNCLDQMLNSSPSNDHSNTVDCSATMLLKNTSRPLSPQEFTQNHLKTGRFHLIGTKEYHEPLYEHLAPHIKPVPLDCKDDIDFVLVGLLTNLPHQPESVDINDPDSVRQHYQIYLKQCLSKDVPLVIANPDVYAPNGMNSDGTQRLVVCPGFIAELYQEMGGKVLYFGKPFATIYRYLLSDVEQQQQQQQVSRVLCIGDNVSTDVLGARQAGLDVALILGGIHNISTTDNESITSQVDQLCTKYQSPKPTYTMQYLQF